MKRALPWRRRVGTRADALAQAEAALTAQAWQRMHRASRRWALWGVRVGTLLALLLFAPAAWLAQALASASRQRVLLVQPRGTLWEGSAALVLGAGPDSQDAVLLPGRLHWTLRPAGLQALLTLRQDCCMEQPLQLRLQPGLGRLRTTTAVRSRCLRQGKATSTSGSTSLPGRRVDASCHCKNPQPHA